MGFEPTTLILLAYCSTNCDTEPTGAVQPNNFDHHLLSMDYGSNNSNSQNICYRKFYVICANTWVPWLFRWTESSSLNNFSTWSGWRLGCNYHSPSHPNAPRNIQIWVLNFWALTLSIGLSYQGIMVLIMTWSAIVRHTSKTNSSISIL